MNADLGSALQWFQLIAIVVGFITVLIKVGNTQGKQEEKNKNFEQSIKAHDEAMGEMRGDITEIKLDVREIKTSLGIK